MSHSAYTIETAKQEDRGNIDNFIKNHFFSGMPLFRIFGIKEFPPINSKSDDTIAFVLKAVSKENDTIGVAVNRRELVSITMPENADERLIQLDKFKKYVDKAAKVGNLPQNTVELRILSVAPDWTGRGVATRLAEESVKTAKLQGFQVMKVCCTSEFTTKIVQSLGFQEIYKMAYSDYPDISGSDIVLDTFPPHFYIRYYIKYLQD